MKNKGQFTDERLTAIEIRLTALEDANRPKIVSIKRRWALFTVLEWRVGVEQFGTVRYYNCWAGVEDPCVANLMWSLRSQMRKDTGGDRHFNSLIGKVL